MGEKIDEAITAVAMVPVVAAILPFALATEIVCGAGKLLAKAALAGYELVRGDEHQRELRRTIRARNEAIRNIVGLHQQAERDMVRLMQERNRRRVLTRREWS